MPEPEPGEERDHYIERCIPMVIEDGTAKDGSQASAICHTMWEEANAKSLTVNLGAEFVQVVTETPTPEGKTTTASTSDSYTSIASPVPGEKVIHHGGTVKALGDGKIGGYLISFGDENTPDLENEYFTKDTDFGEVGASDVYYNHGFDEVLGLRKLTKATLKADDIGIWTEAQLAMRDEYERAIYQLAEAGKLGWSSGTLPHLVEREDTGKAVWLKKWPIGLDASLTPTPAEPRNQVITLKSLMGELQQPQPATGKAGAVKSAQSDSGKETVISQSLENNTEGSTMELTEEKLKEITTASEQATKKLVEEAVEKALKALPASPIGGVLQVITDEADQPFKSWGEYFLAVRSAAYQPELTDKKLIPLRTEDKEGFYLPTKVAQPIWIPGAKPGIKASGLSEGIPAEGGYLVSSQIVPAIIERMYASGAILSRVAMDNVGPNSNGMTYNAVDETSRANGSRWGGILGYWLGEAATKTSSKPTFRQIELKLKKIAALAYATDELLQDATALGGWLMRTVPEELRFRVEDALFEGDGVAKPHGFSNCAARVSVLRAATTAVAMADVIGMWARRWTGVSNYAWFTNQDVLPQLYQMGSTYQLQFMPPGGLSGAMYAQLFGKPVIEVEFAQTLGTEGDIVLADLSQYQAIQKGGVEAAQSIHVAFTTDETCFRFVYRIDGRPLWASALTPFHGSNTQSPYVTLSAATA